MTTPLPLSLPTASASTSTPQASTAPGAGTLISRIGTGVPPPLPATTVDLAANGESQEIAQNAWLELEARGRKRKWASVGYDEREMQVMERNVVDFQLALALDQAQTLFPPSPTPFSSLSDVVDRLVPYHIWQIHDEEMYGYMGSGGRKKVALEEEGEAKHAAQIINRMASINTRFHALRRRDAQQPSPLPSLIAILKESTASIREELSSVHQSLRQVVYQKDQLVQEAQRADAAERKRMAEARAEGMIRQTQQAPAAAPAPGLVPKATFTSTSTPAATPGTVARGRPRINGKPTPTSTTTPAAPVPIPVAASATPTPVRATRSSANIALDPNSSAHTAVGSGSGSGPNSPAPTPSSIAGNPALSGPVNVTMPASSLKTLIQMGVLSVPPHTTKAPGTLLKTSDDKTKFTMSIDLRLCSHYQLSHIASILKLSHPDRTSASPTPTPAAAARRAAPAAKK